MFKLDKHFLKSLLSIILFIAFIGIMVWLLPDDINNTGQKGARGARGAKRLTHHVILGSIGLAR